MEKDDDLGVGELLLGFLWWAFEDGGLFWASGASMTDISLIRANHAPRSSGDSGTVVSARATFSPSLLGSSGRPLFKVVIDVP